MNKRITSVVYHQSHFGNGIIFDEIAEKKRTRNGQKGDMFSTLRPSLLVAISRKRKLIKEWTRKSNVYAERRFRLSTSLIVQKGFNLVLKVASEGAVLF